MRFYVTSQGDMWDAIAFREYGSSDFTDVLINANPEYREIYIFSDGIILNVPDVEERVSPDDLPPWKQAEG